VFLQRLESKANCVVFMILFKRWSYNKPIGTATGVERLVEQYHHLEMHCNELCSPNHILIQFLL
jgi:hypothetical protein